MNRKQAFRQLLGTAAVTMALALSGCGGGGGSGGSPASALPSTTTQGRVTLSLTDAPGDFLAYSVDLTSLQLVNMDGRKTPALPSTTRIDFTQYTDLSEILTVAQVPAGSYTQVVMNLDFSNADIEVTDSQGGAAKANVVNSDGQSVTTLPVILNLPANAPLVAASGVPSTLALDFDLSASNQVDMTSATPTVTVEPFMMAQLPLDTSREHRARGMLTSVDTTSQDFQIQLRPFGVRQHDWGHIRISTGESTQFDINGQMYTGAGGMAQLATLAADTPVVVKGTVAGKQQLAATEVAAGSSVPWTGKDVVQGTVLKRVGNDLRVRGHYINRSSGVAIFNNDIDVRVDSSTEVTRFLGDKANLSAANLSTGQRITAFGILSQDGGSGAFTLDSSGSDNLVHMDVTQVKGTLGPINGNLITTDLAVIDGQGIDMFDFTGTGTSPATDSNPAQYHINTGALPLTGINVQDVLQVRGYVQPFGQVNGTDFDAVSVIDLNQSNTACTMMAHWTTGSHTAISSMDGGAMNHGGMGYTGTNGGGSAGSGTNEHMVMNLSGADNDFMWLSGIRQNLAGTSQVTVQPANSTGQYAIKTLGQPEINFYQSFADFSSALASRMGSGALVMEYAAHGRCDSGASILNSQSAMVLLSL